MTDKIEPGTWVYVVVQNPGNDEHIVGQEYAENQLAFIPAFINKDAALMGMGNIIKEKGHKYEVQAIIFEDLIGHATQGSFLIFFIDDEGKVLKKFSPTGEPL
jgi:hypothetical protein